MSLKSFKGGVHPPHNKSTTENIKVEQGKTPEKVIIPLQQHIGAPLDPLVKVGDTVKIGQKIADSKAFVSAPVHATVSGTVEKIEKHLHPMGNSVNSVFINSDKQEEYYEELNGSNDLNNISPDEIKKIIRESGIVGLGGATFPTHVKLSPPPDKKIDTIIINGAECEPYLTSDYRLMLEKTEDLIFGIETILKSVNVDKGYIAIENNKEDAIKTLNEATKDNPKVEVIGLETKYPQGGEKQLIKAVTKREVPSGGLPMDVGVIVQNIGTSVAIAEAIKNGIPIYQRVVTITGSCVKEPKNLMVRIGTSMRELIEQCGGIQGELGKIIMGGPMMGLIQSSLDVPVIKGTSGILLLDKKEADNTKERACIKCARCVDVCPIYLMPTRISQFAKEEMWEETEKYDALDCIECGSCSYICPAKIPLAQRIKLAKSEIMARRKKE